MSSKTCMAHLLGVGTNPYYPSADPHQSKPDSTALASQYSNPPHTNNNASSKDRSAASYMLGRNAGDSKKNGTSTKRNFGLR